MIKTAVELLRNDQVAAIPTETVYGLAASIFSESALKKIFQVKRRPFTDPLIVHVCSIDQAKSLTKDWNRAAQCLADALWPGPLTLVLEKNEKISDLITSGLPNVALRMPAHPMALKIIEEGQVPLAAPSANRFGKTSPTTAGHVAQEFGDEVFIVDGGPCSVGIESTVVSLTSQESDILVSVLRPGHVKLSQIEAILKQNTIAYKIVVKEKFKASPGQMKHHYMPHKPLVMVEAELDEADILKRAQELIGALPDKSDGVEIVKPLKVETMRALILSESPQVAARELYAQLRECAEGDEDILLFRKTEVHTGEDWEAVLERLGKACSCRVSL